MKNLLIVLLATIMLIGCQQKEKELITERIQYDVNIKSPDPDYDWWIQNLPGPQREKFIDQVIDGALSGKYQTFDYYNQPITPEVIEGILSDTILYTIVDEEPPYDARDTMVINQILKEDILRIRFLEEWRIDPNTLQVEKKVLGIAPIARRPDLMGMERWQPLFWVYTDEEFTEELEKQKE